MIPAAAGSMINPAKENLIEIDKILLNNILFVINNEIFLNLFQMVF